jgi:hypothetical protein
MPNPVSTPAGPGDDASLDYWLSGPDLAAWLGFHKTTLLRLRKRGLPFVGSGRLRRYHVQTVIGWLSRHA